MTKSNAIKEKQDSNDMQQTPVKCCEGTKASSALRPMQQDQGGKKCIRRQ